METSANKREQAPLIDVDFLTTDQVVELLGFSAPTVRKLVKLGHLPAHRPPGGRKLLFLRSEVQTAVSAWSPPRPDGDDRGDAPALVLTIDADGEERWEPLDSLTPEVQAR